MDLNLLRLLRVAQEDAPPDVPPPGMEGGEPEPEGEEPPAEEEETEEEPAGEEMEEPGPGSLVFDRPVHNPNADQDAWEYENNLDNTVSRWGGETFAGLSRQGVMVRFAAPKFPD